MSPQANPATFPGRYMLNEMHGRGLVLVLMTVLWWPGMAATTASTVSNTPPEPVARLADQLLVKSGISAGLVSIPQCNSVYVYALDAGNGQLRWKKILFLFPMSLPMIPKPRG